MACWLVVDKMGVSGCKTMSYQGPEAVCLLEKSQWCQLENSSLIGVNVVLRLWWFSVEQALKWGRLLPDCPYLAYFISPYHTKVPADIPELNVNVLLLISNKYWDLWVWGSWLFSCPAVVTTHSKCSERCRTLETSTWSGNVKLANLSACVNKYPVCLLVVWGSGWMDGPEQLKDRSLACRNVRVGLCEGCSPLVTSSSFSRNNGQRAHPLNIWGLEFSLRGWCWAWITLSNEEGSVSVFYELTFPAFIKLFCAGSLSSKQALG